MGPEIDIKFEKRDKVKAGILIDRDRKRDKHRENQKKK